MAFLAKIVKMTSYSKRHEIFENFKNTNYENIVDNSLKIYEAMSKYSIFVTFLYVNVIYQN